MRLVLRGKIIDANVEPVLLVFSRSDLDNIVEMSKNKRRFYMAFPEKENMTFCRNLFERWKKLIELFEQRRANDPPNPTAGMSR